MPDVLRPRSLSDLVSVVPVLLGFHPSESLVAFCLHDPGGRIGFRLRVDLPPPSDAREVAAMVAGYLIAQEPSGVVVVTFSEDAEAADAATAALHDLLADADVDVREAARFDGERVFSGLCGDAACCPPDGETCDPSASSMLAAAVFHGVEVLPDRESLARRFEATGAVAAEIERAAVQERGRLVRARRALRRRGLRGVAVSAALTQLGLKRARPILSRLEDDRADPSPADIGVLAVWVAQVPVRDVAWARIDREHAAAALSLWRTVATQVDERYAVAPLCLAAFAAWLSGDGAQAQCALDRVARLDDGCSMAALLQRALTECIDPRTWTPPSQADVVRMAAGVF